MAYLEKIISHVSNSSELRALFQKRNIMKSQESSSSPCVSERKIGNPAETRFITSLSVSSLVTFLDNIKYHYYIEKNYKHRDAQVEVYNFTRCLGLGECDEGKRRLPHAKVFVLTILCKGTALCRPAPLGFCSPTSRRRYCGYGVRMFAQNGRPDVVIVEEFGRHNDELGEKDEGFRLIPPLSERKVMSVSMELDAAQSYSRGLTTSKHVVHIAEKAQLNGQEGIDDSDTRLVHDVKNTFRKFYRLTHAGQDIQGVKNILSFLATSDDYVVETQNLEHYSEAQPLIIFITSKTIASYIAKFGSSVIGLDATFNITMYSFALFAIMGRCEGGGVPFGYFVSSHKSEIAVTHGLIMFKRNVSHLLSHRASTISGCHLTVPNFSPLCICIDKDEAERAAIKTVFPDLLIILCHYHFMVIIVDEARALRHSLTEDQVIALMNVIRKLAASTTLTDFQQCLFDIKSVSISFYKYLEANFLNERWVDTFSEVNREHLPWAVLRSCRSNMLVEVSFRTLKYTIHNGLRNKRLDELLFSIVFKLIPYFIVREKGSSIMKPRLLPPLSVRQEGTLLFRNGHVIKKGECHFDVLSSDGNNLYEVLTKKEEEVEFKCKCPQFLYYKKACKHIMAVKISTQQIEAESGSAIRTNPNSSKRGRPALVRPVKQRRLDKGGQPTLTKCTNEQ